MGTLTMPAGLVAPERSMAQRMEALQRGNEIRSSRKQLKRDMKHGLVPVFDVLAEPGPDVATMKVMDLLLATPKIGRVKANKLLSQARVSPSKTLAGMTERQRGELLVVMGRRVPRPGAVL